MAQFLQQPKAAKGARKGLPAAMHIDMTPMVDLGFLLITFFIFTSTLAKSNATNLLMPKDGKPSQLKESNALTLLLHNNDVVYVYEGEWEAAHQKQKVQTASFNGQALRSIIQKKQSLLGVKRTEWKIATCPTVRAAGLPRGA